MTFHLAVVRAGGQTRLHNVVILTGLILWMVYTRFFFAAQAVHATLPVCMFLTVTHHPCPFCGGTRSFAYMWQGSPMRAAAIYPLGPLLFFATLAAIPVLAVALILNRDLALHAPARTRNGVLAAGLAGLGVSWALKLTVLPN